MKATYRLRVEGDGPDPAVERSGNLGAMELDGVNIAVKCEHVTGRITEVLLTISGLPIRRDPESGSIRSSSPELEARAFTAASYIANMLRIETGLDGIDPFRVIGNTPEIGPETQEEEREFSQSRRSVGRSIPMSWAVRRLLSESDWQRWKDHVSDARVRSAAATYSDAIRASSPFLKFEQFFKVVEHFFPTKKGKPFDVAVSVYLSALDPSVDELLIKKLRELRIRSMHAEPRQGPHLSPQRLSDLHEVNDALPEMERVARILLRHPPP